MLVQSVCSFLTVLHKSSLSTICKKMFTPFCCSQNCTRAPWAIATIRYYSIIIINNSLAGGELVSIWAYCICCVYVVCIFVCVWFHIYYIYIYKYIYFVVILTAMWMCVFFSTFYSHELFSFNANNSEICIYIYVTQVESALHSWIPFSLTISFPLSLVIYLSLCLSLYYIYVCECTEIRNIIRQLKTLKNHTRKYKQK